MIRQVDIRRHDDAILLGIATEDAVLDILTNMDLLRGCLATLEAQHSGAVWVEIGKFGSFIVTLYISHDDSMAIVVDGPEFEFNRSQCAQIWLPKAEFHQLVADVLSGKKSS
jgi:hypothetical protein